MADRSLRMSIVGIVCAIAIVLGFLDWFVHVLGDRTLVPLPDVFKTKLSLLWATASSIAHGLNYSELAALNAARADRLFNAMRVGLAAAGMAACLIAALIFHKARDNAPARIVAWMLVGYAGFTLVGDYLLVDARYTALWPYPALQWMAMLILLAWLAMLFARFLVIFPRPVDGESILASYDTLLWVRAPPEYPRRLAFLPLHRHLVDGRLVWIIPLTVLLTLGGTMALDRLLESHGGLSGLFTIVAMTAYVLIVLPLCFASTTHLFRNGSANERTRVAWLRAWLIFLGVIVALFNLLALLMIAGDILERYLFNLGGLVPAFPKERLAVGLGIPALLLPTVAIFGLVFAVLYRGALDPRVAITRVTLWSVLGIGVTLGFVVIERLLAMKVVAWLGLPPEGGAVMAGAVIAGTFVPVRRVVERSVTKLADRYLPVNMIADGERVVKTVMVSDLSGYTALSATDEPRALLLSALLKRQAERIVGSHGGKVVKTMGDAVMVTFATNDGAIAAARELHGSFASAAGVVGVEPLPLHTALHRGEIVESHDGDIYGQTVNVTARLVDAAAAHELVMSDTVREGMNAAVQLTDIGERKFKNVPQPVACFRVEL